jgi:hypothetical protein
VGHELRLVLLGLLLGIRRLRSALGLLVLLALPLINRLRDGVSADALAHLRALALAGVNRADQPGLGLRRALVGGQGDQRAARDARDVLLLAGGQVRLHLARGLAGSEELGRGVSGVEKTAAAAGPLVRLAPGQGRCGAAAVGPARGEQSDRAVSRVRLPPRSPGREGVG